MRLRLSLAPASARALFRLLNERWVELADAMGSDIYALAHAVDPAARLLKRAEVEGKFAAGEVVP